MMTKEQQDAPASPAQPQGEREAFEAAYRARFRVPAGTPLTYPDVPSAREWFEAGRASLNASTPTAVSAEARDAARYRWLRDHGLKYANVGLGTTCEGVDVVDFSPTFTIPEPVGMRYEDNEWSLDDLDAALDVAMKEKKS